jgi:signal transduction histidine kinase
MLKIFENQIDSKDLKSKIHYKGRCKVWGNKLQLEQLLFNLLDNAVKYSIRGSELKISLKNIINKGLIELSVTNASKIIKGEDLPHIFNRFYRSAISTDRKSFGLGLSISKKIVENHKGSIKVDYNKSRKEVTFKIFLPLYKNLEDQ